jgi:HEPN domain-containing protein
MSDLDNADSWLSRAASSLERARQGKFNERVHYEDLCYDCQQVAEKSLKALLVFLKEEFPWTHSINKLTKQIEVHHSLPTQIIQADLLTRYATKMRYPGDYDPITEDDFKEALELAEFVFNWVMGKIGLL